MDEISADDFLSAYPTGIRTAAGALRGVVKRAVPDAVERVRFGWRLIGYDVPVGRRSRYFAFVAPEPTHVHLGFEYGVWMADPGRILKGAHLRLRKVRYVTFEPGQAIPKAELVELSREAARLAAMSTQERMSLLLDRDWEPDATSRVSDGRDGG